MEGTLARRRARRRPDQDGEKLLADLAGRVRDGVPVGDVERVVAFRKFAETGKLVTLEPLLPLLLNLKGKPYTLREHFPFSPMFRARVPRRLVLKTARQVSKSTSLASSGILFSNSVPHVTTLYLTPLFEQIRRFSANFIKPFIDQSPVKSLWSNTTTENSVLQRSFRNYSKMIFSFAFLDADRIRGITADICNFDEVQDLDKDHIPIVQETMSYSAIGISRFTGTPKTLDNTLEVYWQRSSQAEWFVPCLACGVAKGPLRSPTWNIPSLDFHIDRMIGPYDPAISPARPGIVCHRCGRPIDPRAGRWVHRHPELKDDFAGYHVPQIIMPEHCFKPTKWSLLLSKREYMSPAMFHNEVLGESYDVGSKLCTLTELDAASCLPWKNTLTDVRAAPDADATTMLDQIDRYPFRVLGVDWGGGGKDEVSYTTLALVGFRADGRCDVLWGKRLMTPHDHLREAREIIDWVAFLRPHFVAHDYTGAGTVRETVLIQAGTPIERVIPIAYARSASQSPFNPVRATPIHPRDHYIADKTRTLLYTVNCVKLGCLRFFKPDYQGDERRGLLRDFLALIDEKVESHTTAGLYTIKRQEGFSDDFAHAVNLGCCVSWHFNQAWPDFATMAEIARLTPQQMTAAAGVAELGWDSDPQMGDYFGGGY